MVWQSDFQSSHYYHDLIMHILLFVWSGGCLGYPSTGIRDFYAKKKEKINHSDGAP